MTATVKDLVSFAYNVRHFQVLAGESWSDSDKYDISAKAEGNPTNDELRSMLQSLLGERFALKLHHETKEETVYSMIAAKGGAKLKEVSTRGKGIGFGRGRLRGFGVTLGEMALVLSNSLDRSVEDHTGLKGLFDFTLTWNADGLETDTAGSSIFTAIQEQLGLKLIKTKGPVERLVIDHVQHPSGN